MSNKSLTEAAKAVLEGKTLEEGYGINYPSVGSGKVSNPNPVDPSTASTGNAKTLHPGTKYKEGGKRPQNGAGASSSSDFEGVQHDLGGQTPTSLPSGNLGAAAASDVGKDSSRAGQGSVAAEKIKKLKSQPQSVSEDEVVEGEVVEEEIEMSEELGAFIEEGIEAGLSEEEILAAIDENFEFVTEESEEDIAEALDTYEVDMSEHAKWQLRTAMANVAELAEEDARVRAGIALCKAVCGGRNGCTDLGCKMLPSYLKHYDNE